ncbi:hypothetical protein IW152_005056 [Coemansia sp. BCRC 34962]|nr:hypothetical protein IW152_005056 [Coemansia sp. BCRC 34962]
MDVDTDSDASSDSDSDSDSDSSDSADAKDEGLEREPLAEDSDDDLANEFKARSNKYLGRVPFKYRTTQFIEPIVRRWPVHRTKYTYDYEPEDIRPAQAHRTMQGLLADRTNNITRQIILRGDMPNNDYSTVYSNRRIDVMSKNAIQWPAIDYRRYMKHIQADRLLPIGIDHMRGSRELYTSAGLEEPGQEWDQRQIDFLYGGEAAEGGSASLVRTGYVHGFTAARDGDEIADTRKNGGMGIVVKRPKYASTTGLVHSSDEIEFLTYLQIKYPGLAEARSKRVPLLDAFEGRAPDVLSNYYLSVVDMTRTQVLGQVLQATSDSQLPLLSKFVSCSVAEEAVSGVSRIWDKVSESWRHKLEAGLGIENGRGRKLFRPYPGSAKTGWISVLEAAIVSDIPPEVIARCYHRLIKLCDVPVHKDERFLSRIFAKSRIIAKRRYAPQALGSEEEEEDDNDEESDSSQGCTEEEPNAAPAVPRVHAEKPDFELVLDSEESDVNE